MNGARRDDVEVLLPSFARDDDAASAARARSWPHVRAALRVPPPTSWWVRAWRPLTLASAVAAAAAAFVALQPPRAVVAAVHGQVTAAVGGQLLTLRAGDELPAGTLIETPSDGWVALRIGADRLSVDTDSRVMLRELSKIPARVVLEQATGRSWHVPAHDVGREYVVRTDGGDAIARGTAFLVVSAPGTPAEVVTVEGSVRVEGASGSTTVAAGQLARLGAAPPVAEPAPVTRVEAAADATIVDALGRSCAQGSAELPGCVSSGSGFIVLPGAAKDLSLQLRATSAGTIEVVAGGRKTEVAVPGQGTFEIKVEVRRSGSEVQIVVRPEAQRVSDEGRPSRQQGPSGSPRATATRSPEPSRAAERSESPRPRSTAEASRTPEARGTTEARETEKPKEAAEPRETAEPKESAEPKETPEVKRTSEPKEGGEAKDTPKPTSTATRRPTETPRPSPTP